MKIKKWVTFEDEVEIDISAEDISGILSEDPESEQVVLTIINRFYVFMTNTPQAILDKLSNHQRLIIRNALLAQADRLKELPNDK